MNSAQDWIGIIEKPLKPGSYAGINKQAVRRMKDAAVDVIQEGGPRCTDIFIFKDGTGLYEKRKDDWYPADTEVISAYLEENN